MENQKIIGQFQKNSREILRVSASEYNGHPFIDLRIWTIADDGNSLPTKKGVAVRPDLVPQLIELLKKTLADE